MSTITSTQVIEATTCFSCHRAFGLLKSYAENARNIGEMKICHYCPYCGKSQGWGKGNHQREIERLTMERDACVSAQRNAEQRYTDALREAHHFRKSRDGMKGVLAKTKKRISAGTCPCCQRTFQSLSRHMAHMHPDYTKKD